MNTRWTRASRMGWGVVVLCGIGWAASRGIDPAAAETKPAEKPAEKPAAARPVAAPVHAAQKTVAQKKSDPVDAGRELFTREWVPGDPRSHGGDGLGPMYNESSCVGCHNQGGAGGAGPASKNVDIVTAFSSPQFDDRQVFHSPSVGGTILDLLLGGMAPRRATGPQRTPPRDEKQLAAAAKARKERQRKELAAIHPGFLTRQSVVLHRFGTDDGYQPWRNRLSSAGMQFGFAPVTTMQFEAPQDDAPPTKIQADARRRVAAMQQMEQLRMQTQMGRRTTVGAISQVGNFAMLRSQRNPTALFGVGLIDAIPEKVILAGAEKKHAGFPQVKGRAARLKDGHVGRFGWKAQIASLDEFTLTACAVELGLDVAEHPQAGSSLKPKYAAPGHDMDGAETAALVSFVRALPAPRQRSLAGGKDTQTIRGGEALFAKVGCTACHVRQLGEVEGIYSDLLVHDMGPELGDVGSSYGVFVPNSSEEEEGEIPPLAGLNGQSPQQQLSKEKNAPKKPTIGALRQEWRTPPLWGLRDSSPYLHDGRAETIAEAIAMHGGEAKPSATKFFLLTPGEQQQVVLFLKSLVALE